MITCSVVIPIHNEGLNIENFFSEFWKNLEARRLHVGEVLLMENGSTDGSLEACRSVEKLLPSIVSVHSIPFPSYGEAVKQGIMRAAGHVVSILEADVLNVDFLASSLERIGEGSADFILASKRHPKSIDRRPLKRRILTYLFNQYLKMNFNFPGTDTHGLKTIRTEVAKRLCCLSMTGGEVFQTEIVLLAYQQGYKVVELPLSIREKRATKVSVTKRLPKVINIVRELNRSLNRFRAGGSSH